LLCCQVRPGQGHDTTHPLGGGRGRAGVHTLARGVAMGTSHSCQCMLTAPLVFSCQVVNGGLRDKPGTSRDHYHTCYCLSGLSIAQHSDPGAPYDLNTNLANILERCVSERERWRPGPGLGRTQRRVLARPADSSITWRESPARYRGGKVANRWPRFGTGRRKTVLERWTNGVRVHVSTRYNRAEGNRWASRNGRVSSLLTEIPHVTIRCTFSSLYAWRWLRRWTGKSILTRGGSIG
jgi:hypothetical protein